MKIKRISKSSIKIFIASFFLTAFFIASLLSFIVVEKNSLKTGVREIEQAFALYTSGEELRLIVNDRELKFSLKPLQNTVGSREFGALMFMLLSF